MQPTLIMVSTSDSGFSWVLSGIIKTNLIDHAAIRTSRPHGFILGRTGQSSVMRVG